MCAAPVSVVIVSWDRPAALARCLTGVGQLYYHPFEVVVVADAPGRAAVAQHPLGPRIKTVAFDAANISAARNAGIAVAGGQIVAFIDDDAVPEPSWLDHLTAPIAGGAAEITGGFVRGRNGISFQWRARVVDAAGQATPIAAPGEAPFPVTAPAGGGVKTEGTNLAAARAHLVALGGFDPRFRFYLDETDLNLRSARAGGRTWLVPRAEVHHGFAASPRRRPDRVPTDLFDIGASSEVFWARHTPEADRAAARAALRAEQRGRLIRHLVSGGCEPRDVRRLLAGLAAGQEAGRTRAAEAPAWPDLTPAASFQPLNDSAPAQRMALLGGSATAAEGLLAQARAVVARGGRASVVLLGLGFQRHNATFTSDGVWLQQGGRFGRADRNSRPGRMRLVDRVSAEHARVSAVRLPFDAR